jgi:ADP-L-glycero-D-manno-heptose 6-epimerase
MIVVTGAAGFVGGNLVRALNQAGRDDLLLVDEVSPAEAERRGTLAGARFADWMNPKGLLEALARLPVEVVFHQGACTSTVERDLAKMMATNHDFSRDLFERARAGSARLIYASSAAVYGDGERGFREEASCEAPLNPYALSKRCFDDFVRAQPPGPVQVVGLRYFNVYGPGEEHKGPMASTALQFWRQLERSGRAQVFEGSDDFLRDFVFVDDVVAVNLHFLEHPEVSGIFNVGSGAARSFTDMARLAVALWGEGELAWIPFPGHLVGSYQARTCADLTRLRATGFTRRFLSLEEGLARYRAALSGAAPGA